METVTAESRTSRRTLLKRANRDREFNQDNDTINPCIGVHF